MVAVAVQPSYQRLAAGVYWRRRLVALLVLAGLVIAVLTLAARLGREPLIASEPTSRTVRLVSERTHVVQPGDTLWSIARAVQSEGDIRPLVDHLAAVRRGRPLQVGERIEVPVAQEVTVGQQ